MTRQARFARPDVFVAAASAAYAIVFFALGYDRYATFHAGADLGLFTQSIAGAFHGLYNTVERGSHFTYHFSPILYLCAPFVWLTRSALSLVAIQAVANALVAPALYGIARRRVNPNAAAGLACFALLYPPLQGVTFTEFHELGLLPAAIAWLLWALDGRRFAIAGVLLVATLGIKEDQALAMAFLGACVIAYFARRGERNGVAFGAGAIVLSAIVFVAYFAVIRPLAGATTHWAPAHFYDWAGYANALPPGRQIVERLTYFLEAFVPLAFVPFRSRALVLAVPGFVEVFASRDPMMYTMGQYYAALWVPYVLVAFVLAACALLASRSGVRWVRAAVVLTSLVLAFFNPLHFTHYLRLPNARDAATNAQIARIPIAASVGTYDEIYAHLGMYPRAQIGLYGAPQYVLFDSHFVSPAWNGRMWPRLRREIARGWYRLADATQGVLLYERTRPQAAWRDR